MKPSTARRRAPHVVFCVQNLPVPHDPRVWRESRDLAAAGYRVSVVCPHRPGLARRELVEGVDIIRYPGPPLPPGLLGQAVETLAAVLWTAAWALRLRARGPVDVLHAANPPDTFFLVGLLLRPFGTRFVYDQHDAVPELLLVKLGRRPALSRVARLLERWSYRTATMVVAPNESYRRLAMTRGGKGADDVVVVRSGPDKVEALARPEHDDMPTVTFAGAMDTQDGIELLVDAAAKVLQRRPGLFRLELIGDGDGVERLRDRAGQLGIGEAVTWPGWLTGEAFRRRLGAATVAVSPDCENPFTLVSTMTKVTDYLGSGLACVVADLPENRATAKDAVAYFRPGDADDLAVTLERVLDDRRLAADLRARALRRASELCWANSSERLLAAYGRLLPRIGDGTATSSGVARDASRRPVSHASLVPSRVSSDPDRPARQLPG